MYDEHKLCRLEQKYEHDLLSFGMTGGFTVLFTMIVIGLGSLAHMLQYDKTTTGK